MNTFFSELGEMIDWRNGSFGVLETPFHAKVSMVEESRLARNRRALQLQDPELLVSGQAYRSMAETGSSALLGPGQIPFHPLGEH